jgi:hypothetical protein
MAFRPAREFLPSRLHHPSSADTNAGADNGDRRNHREEVAVESHCVHYGSTAAVAVAILTLTRWIGFDNLVLHEWRGSCHVAGVDCRIEITRSGSGVVVYLAGRLGHAQVPDLVASCARAGLPLRVDLSELIAADAVGIDALLRVRDMGAVLDNVPTYLQLKIDSLELERRSTPGQEDEP